MAWVLALLLVAIGVIWLGLRLRTGLPWAGVVASDTGGRTLDKPLFAQSDPRPPQLRHQ